MWVRMIEVHERRFMWSRYYIVRRKMYLLFNRALSTESEDLHFLLLPNAMSSVHSLHAHHQGLALTPTKMLTDAWYAQPSEPLQGSRQHSDADAVSHAERQQAGLHSHVCACLCRSVNAAQHGALHEYSQQHDVCNKSLQQQAGGQNP